MEGTCPLVKLCRNLQPNVKIRFAYAGQRPHCPKIQPIVEGEELEDGQSIGWIMGDWSAFLRTIAAYYAENDPECRLFLGDLLAAEAIGHRMENFLQRLREGEYRMMVGTSTW